MENEWITVNGAGFTRGMYGEWRKHIGYGTALCTPEEIATIEAYLQGKQATLDSIAKMLEAKDK